jgi:CRP-like cAMP-binding protein
MAVVRPHDEASLAIRAALSATVLFSRALDTDILDLIARGARMHEIAAGRTVYNVGDRVDGVYLVVAAAGPRRSLAAIDLFLATHDGDGAAMLGRVHGGEVFGEVELLEDRRERCTFAVAASACKLLLIEKGVFAEALERDPALRRRMLRFSLTRLREAFTEAAEFQEATPDVILARWLLHQAETFGLRAGGSVRFSRRFSQVEIADALGVKREAASLRLNAWERAGIMDTGGQTQKIVIHDLDRVRQIEAAGHRPSLAKHADGLAQVAELVARADYFRARNMALDLIAFYPRSAALRYNAMLATARAGATGEASAMADAFGYGPDVPLDELEDEIVAGQLNPMRASKGRTRADLDEALRDDQNFDELQRARLRSRPLFIDIASLAARIEKDLAFSKVGDGSVRKKHLQRAFERYQRIFLATRSAYAGVNAAALAAVAGNLREADRIAGDLLARPIDGADYWDLATHAECRLLRGEREKALALFVQASRAPNRTDTAVASTLTQLQRLELGLATEFAVHRAGLAPRRAMIFAGHLIPTDEARAAQREDWEASVKSQALRLIGEETIGIAYGALARGGDILIAEAALEAGVELHVVLPASVEAFAALSVTGEGDEAEDAQWHSRYQRCLDLATSVRTTDSGLYKTSACSAFLSHGNRIAAGEALLKAEALRSEALLVAVHDGVDAGAPSGTAALIAAWRDLGHRVRTIACPWPRLAGARMSEPSDAASVPFGPCVFAWRTHGRAPAADRAMVGLWLATTGATWRERRALGNRQGHVATTGTLAQAVAIAMELAQASALSGSPLRLLCDHGPLPARDDEPQVGHLAAASDPVDLPGGHAYATRDFAAIARFEPGFAYAFVPAGRIRSQDGLVASTAPIFMIVKDGQ